MRRVERLLFIALSINMPVGAAYGAEASSPVAGEYLTEGAWGNLAIRAGKTGALDFTIESVGPNGHSCSLDGAIRNGRATLEGTEKGKSCIVTFKATGGGVEVASVDSNPCRTYCGARAGFEGLYLKPAAGCDTASLALTRTQFRQLYDRRSYAAARVKLEAALKRCAKTLHWIETGWMQNDLAITQHRLGDDAGCRRTLESFAEQALASDQEVRESLPPADGDNWLPVVQAARTNLRLCANKVKN